MMLAYPLSQQTNSFPMRSFMMAYAVKQYHMIWKVTSIEFSGFGLAGQRHMFWEEFQCSATLAYNSCKIEHTAKKYIARVPVDLAIMVKTHKAADGLVYSSTISITFIQFVTLKFSHTGNV